MGWKMLVSYIWRQSREDVSVCSDKPMFYSYLQPTPELTPYCCSPTKRSSKSGYRGSPAFRRKGLLKRQGSVSPPACPPANFTSRLKPPGSGIPLPRSIPTSVSTSSSSTSSSSSSKEVSSSSSPSSSCRSSLVGDPNPSSRIPISKSQDDLVNKVQLRQSANRPNVLNKPRPTSYRNSISSPRNSKLMSRNSVEVLSYHELHKNSISGGTSDSSSRKSYGQFGSQKQNNNKHEAPSKLTKKPGSVDPTDSLGLKVGKLSVTNEVKNSVLASPLVKPGPSSRIPGPLGRRSQIAVPSTVRPTSSVLQSTGGQNRGAREKHTTQVRRQSEADLATEEKKEFSMTNDSKKVVTRGTSLEIEARPGNKKTNIKLEAEKVLTEQLLRGKVPPKAKFRADDEISIGDPDQSLEYHEQRTSQNHGLVNDSNISSPCSSVVTAKEVQNKNLPVKCSVSVNSSSPGKSGALENVNETGSIAGPSAPEKLPRLCPDILPIRHLVMEDRRAHSLPFNSSPPTSDQDKTTNPDKPNKPSPLKTSSTSGDKLFQRLTNLRRSLSGADQRRVRIRPHFTANNTTFFAGIEEELRSSTINTNKQAEKHPHGAYLSVPAIIRGCRRPPARKYQSGRPWALRRCLSFSDAQTIAQVVSDLGDSKVVNDLYPGFPFSESIYTVIDRAKSQSEKPCSDKTSPRKPPLIDLKLGETNTKQRMIVASSENSDVETLITPKKPLVTLREPGNLTGITRCNTWMPGRASPPTVTNILVDPSSPPQHLMISPWSNPSHSNTAPCTPPVTFPDVKYQDSPSQTQTFSRLPDVCEVANQPHPFIYRVQNQATYPTQSSPPTPLFSLGPRPVAPPTLSDPFRRILAAADDNICQAESILSSLGYDGLGVPSLAASEEDTKSVDQLGSDIEANIRRLELTQAKINAALDTFRTVRNMQLTPRGGESHSISFCSLPAVQRFEGDLPEEQGGHQETAELVMEGKKAGIVRRHSFNNLGNKERSPGLNSVDSGLTSYDGDAETSDQQPSNRNSVVYEETSDTESTYTSPFRSRIRGIFGSFGKAKKGGSRMHSEEREAKKLITIEYPNEMDRSENSSLSIGQFTELVKNLPAHHYESPVSSYQMLDGEKRKKPTFLRPRDPCQTLNSDTSTLSSNANYDLSSNRNSVVSTQSNSSESYDTDRQDAASIQSECGEDAGEELTISSTSPGNQSPTRLTLSKTQEKKVYYIAKEIMTSERVYVDVLRLLNIEFRDFVQRARFESKSGIMPDQDFVKLFSNLPELMMLNEDLLRDFEERVGNWDNAKKMSDVIIRKGPYLKLYTVYIRDFSAMNFHFDECCQRYPKFGKLVKEFEKLARCQHLKLKHFMLKPVQRLPQYKLLLEDYLKHLASDSIDFDDTTLALKIVSDAAEHANDTVKQGDKFQTMLKLQSRLGDWEFIRPGRELVKEGELQKISRKGVGPRYFVLLSDCLLYTTYQGSWAADNTSLKVSYTIPLNQLHVHVPSAEDYQTEFSITSNVRSCTLRARDVGERNGWLDALNSAIEEYRSRKATFVTLDQLNPVLRFEGKIGDSAPVWIPDQRVTMCQNCSAEFSLVNRRHHCRACGAVVCAQCSGNKAPLRYRQFEASRVCDSCYEAVEKIYGDDMDLRTRFKRRDMSRAVARFVPQRLKLSANPSAEVGQGAGRASMAGYLRCRRLEGSWTAGGGLGGGRWKRCWFVLRDRVLYTYRASEDTVATDTLPVLGWDIVTDVKDVELGEAVSSGTVFQLRHQGSHALVFAAENENSAMRWRNALSDAISFS